jgi:hypothetical protein
VRTSVQGNDTGLVQTLIQDGDNLRALHDLKSVVVDLPAGSPYPTTRLLSTGRF